jgi:hypothetical protein
LECEVVIPAQDLGVSAEDSLILHCRAEVIRVVADGLKPGYGLACRLKSYTVSRQASPPAGNVRLCFKSVSCG